jgi:hypothetical protein
MYQSSHCPYDEERLVARCLRGEVTAWETMFDFYNPKLVSVIKVLLHGESGAAQAEDIASAVWSSLCSVPYTHLERYDAQAGKLLSHLVALARREIWRERRSKRSRYSRECSVARKEAAWEEVGRGIALNEFLATLTGREREFCLSELLPQAEPTLRPPLSVTNGWKLKSRVLKKFRNYFLEKNPSS